jgi:DNA-binding PadR family transcriptional regulator
VYPALERLETAGYLTSTWEDAADAHAAGRPARRYFTLTAAGAIALRAALAKYRALRPLPGLAAEDA